MRIVLYDEPYKKDTYQIVVQLNPLDVNELINNQTYKYEIMLRFLEGVEEFRHYLLKGERNELSSKTE